jgi:hypothetical protein
VPEPESKGSGFGSAVAALRKMVPADAFERMVATLPPETADLVRHPPLPVAWISTHHFRALITATAQQLFGGDEKKLEEWGRQALLSDLRGIYKMFIRFLSPQFVIERGAKLWDTYSRNMGTARATAAGDAVAEVVYSGLPVDIVSPAYWAYQRGAMKGVMEATGYKTVGIETVEGGGNMGHAKFRVSWK